MTREKKGKVVLVTNAVLSIQKSSQDETGNPTRFLDRGLGTTQDKHAQRAGYSLCFLLGLQPPSRQHHLSPLQIWLQTFSLHLCSFLS